MNKLRHRILSVLLAAVIAGSSCCPSVYAQSGSYAELSGGAVPEQTGELPSDAPDSGCTHICGEDCIRLELTCPLEESGEHTHSGSCYTAVTECTHVHDESCGGLSSQENPPVEAPAPDGETDPGTEPLPDGETVPGEEGEAELDSPEEMESDPAAASDPDPELLSLETLVDEGYSSLQSAMLLTRGLSGSTILLGEDNEDNAHRGKPDNDMDRILGPKYSQHPIEVRLEVPAEKLPQENAYLAIKAYDVDEEGGETDIVTWNGTPIGQLSGTNASWNTTVLEVPVDLIQSGSNYVEITVSEGWVVKIDWFQLLLDGGEKPDTLESFSLELGTPIIARGPDDEPDVSLPVYLQIQAQGDQDYKTEYTLLDQKGNSLAAAFGSPSGSGALTDQALLTPPTGTGSGTYRVVGLLKDPVTEQILARDEASWYYAGPDAAAEQYPLIQYGVTPTNKAVQEVTFTAEATMLEGMTAKSLTISGLTAAPASGTDRAEVALTENVADQPAEITVAYTLDGVEKTITIPIQVSVSNIDREPPVVTVSSDTLKVPGGASQEEIRAQVLALASASDTVSSGGDEAFAGVAAIQCELAADGSSAALTATDHAGNTSEPRTVTLLSAVQPLQLGTPSAARQGESNTFDLSAVLISDGGLTVTETGFVWGVMQNPTLTVNNGASHTSAPAGKGENITARAEIADGVSYYARAYLIADGTTYYSQQITFSIGAKNYGTVTIKNNGGNTFTVSRDDTDGVQTVSYRTVNGSAVGGTHFEHQSGTVTLQEGQTSAVITINEMGANTAYSADEPATAYTNADRTYQVEIFRVEGGAALGDTRFAARTLPTGRKADSAWFEEYTKKGTPWERSRGDKGTDGWGWYKDGVGNDTSARETASVARDGADYWTHTAQSLRYYVTFQAKEEASGYQAIQILPGSTLDLGIYPEEVKKKGKLLYNSGISSIDQTRMYYVALFEHGKDKKVTDWYDYSFPASSFSINSTMTDYHYRSGQSGDALFLPLDTEQVTVGFSACGSGSDKWATKEVKHHIQVYDAVEPQLLGIAPMAETTYKPGDRVTVSLIFDEILDGINSSLDQVSLRTSWGSFQYAGGANTNVLYFTGTVPENAASDFRVDSIEGTDFIKDMCDVSGAGTSSGGGSIDTSVDTRVPVISIENKGVTDGTASAAVRVQNATVQKFVWTRSETLPVNGWQEFRSGETLSTRQAGGETWYLHILAEYDGTGAAAHAYTSFTFPADTVLPTLTASADNTGWARERTIVLAYTPADAAVTMTGPDGQEQPVTGSRTVTENGWYSFTLTHGEETLTQAVEITGIDTASPVLEEMREPNQATPPAAGLVFSAVISDALSGVQSVQYCFTGSASAPSGGWQTAAESGGRYLFDYQSQNPDAETVYLHLKASDRAGNTLTWDSGAYTVQAAPDGSLTLTLSGAPTAWTSGDVTLEWRLTGSTGDTPYTLYGLPTAAETQTSDLSGSFAVNQNGLYTITVLDNRGRSAESSVLVNWIDRQGPVVTGISVPSGWINGEKTVTLQGLTDDLTPLYNTAGEVTGYGGSGVASAHYKKLGSEDEIPVTGSTFAVPESGSYILILTDQAGNQTRQSFTVSGIDTAPPEVQLSEVPSGWQPMAEITLTLSDRDSGIGSVRTRFTSDNASYPTDGLTEHAAAESVTVSTASSSDRYLYYEVTDQAGNVTRGFSGEIHADGTVPAIPTVTQAEGLESQQERAVLTISAGTAGASGLTLWYAQDGGGYQQLDSDTLTLTETGTYSFKAVTGAGSESPVRTVTLHRVSFRSDGIDPLPHRLVLSGGTLTRTADPHRTGYTFTGWQKDGTVWDFAQPVTGDFTLTAGWTLSAPSVSVSAAYSGSETAPFVYNGGDLTLTASADHAADGVTFSYQWYDADGQLLGDTSVHTFPAASAGEYPCTCTVTAVDSYGLSARADDTVTAVIARAPVTCTVSDTRHEYDAGEKQAQVTVDTAVPGLTIRESDYTVRYEQDGAPATPVNTGSYDIILTLENDNLRFDGMDDSLREQKAGTLEITGTAYPEADTMTWPGAGALTYGETLRESVLTGGDQQGKGTYAWKTPEAIPTVENTGCTVVFSPDDPNYAPVEHTVSVAVAPRELTIAGVTAQNRVYDPDSTAVTLTGGSLDESAIVIRDGVPDDAVLDSTRARGTIAVPDAGTALPVTVSGYALTGADAVNYTLAQPDYVTVDIARAAGSGSVTIAGWTYGDTPSQPVVVSDTNGTGSLTFRYTGTLSDGTAYDSPDLPSEAGSYQAAVTFAATGNYEAVTVQSGPFTVAQRRITATWKGLDTIYNGLPQSPEIAGLVGVVPADQGKVTVLTQTTEQTDAGSYPGVTARLSGVRSRNYLLGNGTVTFVIRPAAVLFQSSENSVPYDGQPHTARVTAQALGQEFDRFTLSYQSTDGPATDAPTEPGRYTILAEITDPNYRHTGSTDGSPEPVGILEIYQTAAPAVYPITFLPGAEEVTGTPPSLPDSLAGNLLFLPGSGTLERTGYQFIGWESGGRIYQPGASFTMPASAVTFTAVWAEASGEIGGSVVWDDESDPQPAGQVLITLTRGNQTLDEVLTDADGSFAFRQLPPGAYNLVASYGEITQTAKILLTGSETAQCTIRLPRGKTNSVLKVLDGAPDVVVGNLERLFDQQPDQVYTEADRTLVESGGKVEICMTVQDSRPAPGSALEEAVQNAGSFREGLTLALTLEKSRFEASGASLGGAEPISESNLLMEIVIPLDGGLQNCREYRVLREHDGGIEEIPAAGNQWGEYFVLNEDRTVLTIFAKRFSDYAVLYSNAQPDHGGDDSDSDDSSDSPAPAVTDPSEPAELPPENTVTPAPETAPEPDTSAVPESPEEPESPAPEQPAEPSGTTDIPTGKPFVLLSAVGAAVAVLLAALRHPNRGRSRLPAVLTAAGAVGIALLTTGWNGFVLASPWTLAVAGFALLTGWLTRPDGK